MQYFISYEEGVYARWAKITVPQTAIDGQTVDDTLCFGKPWTGPGGAAFTGSPYHGTLSDWVLSDHAWTELEIAEFFSVPPEQLPGLDLYEKVTSWLKPGSAYPEVVDVTGALTGGALYGWESCRLRDITKDGLSHRPHLSGNGAPAEELCGYADKP